MKRDPDANTLPRVRDGSLPGAAVFLPAIYEHKAALIGRSPAEVCGSARWLAESVRAEFQTYAPVAVVAGVDIYNIEPEAFGCTLACPAGSNEVPALVGNLPALLEDAGSRPQPDPLRSGRMPLMLEAVRDVVSALGSRTMVQAPISGPFTMAAELVGLENLIFAMFDCPQKVDALLAVCLDVARSYGQALLGTGAQVSIFDSRASCSVISPDQYRQYVLPLHARLLESLRRAGADFISLIIGGNTVPVVDSLFAVGADLVIADFTVPMDPYLEQAGRQPTIVRVNVSPASFDTEAGSVAAVLSAAAALHNRRRCILGSGIVPYDTPPRNILAARDALR
jgi:uroporphyrinogen decarboxylase